jgi:hypothetical protein
MRSRSPVVDLLNTSQEGLATLLDTAQSRAKKAECSLPPVPMSHDMTAELPT